MLLFVTTIVAQILTGHRAGAEPIATITNNGINHVLLDSPFTFVCRVSYTGSANEVSTLGWAIVLDESNNEGVAFVAPPRKITHNPSDRSENYTMTYNLVDESGTTNYTIKRAAMADNGIWQCEIALRRGGGYDQDRVAVIINTPPTSLTISDSSGTPYPNESQVDVVEGQETTLECTAAGNSPEATIRWTLDGQQRADWPDGIDTSVVTFIPDWRHHGDIVECIALVPADLPGVKTRIYLDIRVPPTIARVTLSDENNRNGYDNPSETTNVLKDAIHQMSCFIERTRPAPQVTWRLGGVDQSDGITTTSSANPTDSDLYDTTSTFTFTPSQCSSYNDKVVECEAKLEGTSQVVPKSVTLRLHVAPDNPIISNVALVEDKLHSILCQSSNGYPGEGEIWWQIANGEVKKKTPTFDTDDETCVADMTSTYAITPVRSNNGQTITCKVHHPSSSTSFPSSSATLDVKFCSNSINGPQQAECNQQMVAGSQSPVFSCASESSNPATELTWYLDNIMKENTRTPQYAPGIHNGNITTLQFQIEELSKTHNGASLQCGGSHQTISTCTNDRSTGCILNVRYPATITEIKATPTTTDEGNDVELTCEADANPQPDGFISWYKDEMELDGTYTSGKNVLLLTKIDRTKAGTYQCRAVNQINMDSDAVTVTVYYSPNITNKDDYSRGAHEGSEAVLLCRSQSNPESTTSWFDPNGNMLFHGEGRVSILNTTLSGNDVIGITMESELRISNVQPSTDYGNYSCNVANDKGRDSFSIHLNETRRPDIVKNAKVSASALTNITVEWKAGYDGGEDQWFLVSFRTLPNGKYPDYSEYERQFQFSHTFQDLVPGTEYELIIFSANTHGMSKPGVTTTGRTRQIPDPPVSIDIVEANENSISFSWIPGYDGGDAQWFLLDYGKKSNGLAGTKYRLPDTQNKTTHTISGLSPGTSYIIEVYSENRNGINEHGKGTTGDTTGNLIETGNQSAVIVTMAAIIFILIVVILILIIFFNRKQRLQDEVAASIKKQVREDNLGFTKEGCMNEEFSVETSFQKQLSENTYGNTLFAKDFILPRSNIEIKRELGHGEFGKVLKAAAKGIIPGNGTTTVAVKTLKDNANDEAKQLLRKEFEIMKVLMVALCTNMNPNIVLLIGGCMEKDPMYMVLEYMPKGDLKSLLRESRTSKDGNDKTYDNLAVGSRSLSPVQLIKFAQDVANGMAFLATQKCIHRDLAARNVLLNEKYECKVSDFGLAQDVMNIEVYQRTNQCRLPIRWMAIESLDDKVHTLESDVWAYGVLLWEIVTLGARPYPRMKADEIRQMLRTGYRMPKPTHCSEQLYNIMLVCWEKDQSKRPSFPQIIRLLDEIIEGQMGYLTLANIESKLYEDTTIAAPDEKI